MAEGRKAAIRSSSTPRNGLFTNRAHWGEDGASYYTRLTRIIAMVAAVLIGGFSASIIPTQSAQAVVVEWGTNNGTAPNYQRVVNGDFITAGNGVLSCDSAVQTGAGTCANLHAASAPSTTNPNVNDYFRMVNSNTVSGFTTNSSAATVTIPAGATVVQAYLNWSANTGVYTGQTGAYCGSSGFGAATLPSGSATGYQTRAVQLKVGSGAITAFAPDDLREDAVTQATTRNYSATADVTGAFAAVPTGSAVTVAAGNIWAPQGPGCYAGWSVTLVYDFGTYILGNASSVPRSVIYYEGHVREGASDTPLTVAFNGFTAVDVGTRAGFTLYEGDRSIAGDTAAYARGGSTTFTEIPNSAGATGNIGIGRGLGSVRYTQPQDTGAFTNQSVDVTTAPLSNVIAGDSTVNLRVGTSGDSYLLTNAVLSVPVAGIQIDKSYDGTLDTQYRTSAEPATFTIRVTNSGAGTLTNIVVGDDQTNCARTLTGVTLLPLASTTFTCTANANTSASYTSTATATARTLVGNYLANDTDTTTVQRSNIALAKTNTLAAGATGRAGDVVTYTFTATNTGAGPLTGVTITDPLVGLSAITYGTWPSGTVGTLAAGQSVTATATRTLLQTDVDAGAVLNTASTTGTDADGGLKPSATASSTATITPAGTLTLAKTGSYTTGTGAVGSVVTYGFTATNTGNVTLTGVAIADPHAGLSTITYGTWSSGTTGRLTPGGSVTGTATYTVTQADVDAGTISNTATVTGRTPQNATVAGTSNTVALAPVAAAPSLATTKTAAYTTGAGAVGSVITYTFTTRNSGNVTLNGVTIADPLVGLGALSYGTWPSGTTGRLAPGQTVTATATYTVKQADVDAGSVVNRATATGTPPTGAAVSGPSPQVTTPTAAANPAVTLTKSGVASGQTVGSTVTYSFTLQNSGNVTVTGAGITDPLVGLSAITYGTWPSGTTGTLVPGQTVTASATYVLKQSDVDAGSVANAATATAKPPTGANVTQTRAATVPIAPTGALTVTKAGVYTSGSGAVGSTIRFDIVMRNTGNVTLTQVALTDTLAGLPTPVITWPGTAGTLLPGTQATATATYTVTQADVDSGTVRNTASATGRTPQNAAVTGTSTQVSLSTVAAAPGITVVKSGAIAGGATGNAGDVITYTFTVRNSGNVTLTAAAVSDPLAGLGALTYSWPGTAGVLAPGQTATATASYTIKQSDVNTGRVVNTATASGTTPTGGTASGSSGPITTATAAAAPALVTTKSGALATGATGVAGDTVNWTVTIRNSGNQTVTGITATDSIASIALVYGTWPSGTAGTLQPGQTVTATGSSVLTQTDVDAGSSINTATSTGRSPSNALVTSTTASATVPVATRGTLTLTKTPSVTTGARAGDVITYTFVARNTGNVTLTGVAITDPLAGLGTLSYTWPGSAGTLAPNATVTATAPYTVKQSDVDAGRILNTAGVTGRTPTNAAVSGTSGQVTVTTAAPSPALTTTKTAAYTTGSGAVGSVLTYTFTSRNSGNVTLTGVGIADPLVGLSALTYTWPGTAGTLAPNQTVSATATYTVKQADVDAGQIVNRATASGTPPTGPAITGPSPQVTTATAASGPAITLNKSGTAAGSTAGSIVTYTFSLTNAGNVTLTNAAITDPLAGLSAIAYGTWPSGTTGTLLPGQTVTASATYALKQSDIDAGSVANTATATAKPPTGANVTQTKSATVPVTPTGAITVVKTGSVTAGTGNAGSTVTWTFTIRNAGNVTLTQVALADSLPGLSTPVITWPGTAGTLAPGGVATATATSTVTQAQVDAGSARNTATATGRTPAGVTATGGSGEIVVPTAASAPGIAVVKTGLVAGGAPGNAGDVVQYSFQLTNTGNVTLTKVTVADPLSGLSTPNFVAWPGTARVLAPGQSATATASYTIKQSDVDFGSVRNTATASGTPPTGPVTTASSGQVTTPTAASAPALATTKSGALATGATGVVGDRVNWTFSATNTGNVTLTGVVITDPLPGISARTSTWPGTAGTLAPGQTVTATAFSTLTQTDVDAGSIVNTASTTGTPPTGAATTSPTASATVPIAARSALTLTKTPSVTTGARAGDVITYTFVARNTGNVTLAAVAVADPLPGLSARSYSWPGTAGTLAPNQSVTATATYPVTQADVDAGRILNTASVSGRTPANALVSSSSPQVTVTTVAASPALTTTKAAAYTTGSGAVGSVLTYTFTARNSGNVTLTGVSVADPLPRLGALAYGAWPSGTAGTLRPGDTVTATATYTLNQADVDRGSVVNQATASGTPPTGPAISSPSPTVTTATVTAVRSISFAKTGTLVGAPVAGSVVNYGFTLQNTGNVTLTAAAITDPMFPGGVTYGTWPSGTPNTLRPGDTVTATASRTVTQSDVDAGSVVNSATAAATPPTGAALTQASAATVPLTATGTLTLGKTAAYTTGSGAVGSVLTYTFTARNTGNVTLTNVAISDPHAGLSALTYGTWPSGTTGTLRPNDVVTATASYTVSQADVNTGTVTNTATVAGRTPAGTAVSATSPTVIRPTAPAAPAIQTTKTASVSGGGVVGSTVTYTITAENTGNVTLAGVTVSDPMFTAGELDYGTWPSGVAGTLQPTQSIVVTARHIVTQADVNAGSITNTASATSQSPTGAAVADDSDPVVTPLVTRAPAISLTQTGSLQAGSTGKVGDTVTWSFTITNTGNTTLTTVGVAPQQPNATAPAYGTWPSGVAGTLQPGQSVLATSTYVLTQADVDAGSVVDPATASGTAAGTGAVVTASAPATVSFNPTGTITLQKSGTITAGGGGVGSTITYTFVARNTGATTLTSAAVVDTHVGLSPIVYGTWPSGTAGTLRPGDQVTATATYTVTQADFDLKSVSNTASVSARTPQNATVSASSGTVVVPTGTQVSNLVVTKAASPASGAAVGSTITYTFTAQNTGNTTLTGVGIADTDLPGLTPLTYGTWPSGTTGTLLPNQTITATATYLVTQADVDRGSITNRATGTATPPTPGTAFSVQSPSVTTPTQAIAPRLGFVKTGAVTTGTGAAGSTITFQFTVTNIGNVTLNAVGITEQLPDVSALTFGTWPNGTTTPTGTLAPGQSVTATATYVVKQADVDAGAAVNSATASGTPVTGAATSIQTSATVPLTRTSTLTLTKTADAPAPRGVGTTVTYTFVARNTGTVTLTGVGINDALPDLSQLSYGAWPTATPGVLPPNTQVTATATYLVDQDDVDAGSIANTANASGTNPAGQDVTATPASVTTTLQAAAPALAVTKAASITTGARVGDVVNYTMSVRNVGNVTLHGVTVVDQLAGVTGFAVTWPAATGVLAPNATATAIASYRLTQADIDAGSVVNTVRADGLSPTDAPVTRSASATTTAAPAAPSISVTDAGALNAGSTGVAGDRITFSYTVTNTGTVTLTGVALDEALAEVPGSLVFGTWPGGTAGRLAPGQSVTATSTYVLTQADVDAHTVRSDITATGTGPAPASTVVTATTTASVPIAARAALAVAKTGALVAPGIGQVGDRINYTLEATNPGNITLYRVDLVDRLQGLVIDSLVWPTAVDGRIAPGQTARGTGHVIITQADVDRGYIENTASVVGFPTAAVQPGEVALRTNSNTVRVPTVQSAPQLTAVTSGTITTGTGGVGSVVTWTDRITNTGNVSVNLPQGNIANTPALTGPAYNWTNATTVGVLAPGEYVILTGTTTITQTDVDAGSVTNLVSANGTSVRDGAPVASNLASATVPTVTSGPAVSITKSVTPGTAFVGRVGDPIPMVYVLTNTGNVTLTSVSITDPATKTGPIAYDWGTGTAGRLAPGASVRGTATHLLTQADIDAGLFSTVVTGVGSSPTGQVVSATASAPQPITSAPAMTVLKSGALRTNGAAGSFIDYGFSITNTGNVTLTLVDLVDNLAGVTDPVIDWPDDLREGVVLPGQVATATANYRITQADVDRGTVANSATASGKPPIGDTIFVTSNTSNTTVAPAAPNLTVTKTANPTSGVTAGSTITYSIVVTNTGNQTLTAVTPVDRLAGAAPLVASWPGTAGVLAPSQAASFTTSYVATQADIDAGSIANTVDVTAAPPTGPTLSRTATATSTAAVAGPAISVTDAGVLEPGTTGIAGDGVDFTYVVRNSGNVTLAGVSLDEALAEIPGSLVFGAWPGPVGTLAPGQSVTATSRYLLTQADVDAGTVTSTITTRGTSPAPASVVVTNTASAPVTIVAAPALSAVKTGALAPGAIGQVGDRVNYTLTATNTGNVTLYRGDLVDPLPGLVITSLIWPVNDAQGQPIVGFIPPGAVVRGTGYVPLTQADLNRGYLENTAHVAAFRTATAQPGESPVAADTNTVRVPTAQAAPALTPSTTATITGPGVVGNVITWTDRITNSGNVSVNLPQANIQDAIGLTAPTYDWSHAATVGVLAPGEYVLLVGTTTVTQANVDAGSVTNLVAASGSSVRDGALVNSGPASTTVPLAAAGPSIDVTKTAAPGAGFSGRAGDIVEWGYTVRNNGNVTLGSVGLADPLAAATPGITYQWGANPVGTLAVGSTITATALHRVTQAEVDAGAVSSPVTATGTGPSVGGTPGRTVTDTDSAGITIAAAPSLAVTKVGTKQGTGAVGERIDYAFTISNTGNVTLTLVDLVDSLGGVSAPVITWPNAGTPGILLPGQTADATAFYTVTQTDVDSGSVLNTATASGKPPVGDKISQTSTVSTTTAAPAAPALTVTKTADRLTGLVAGSVVNYTITVRNTGNVSLTDVTPTDQLAGVTPLAATWPGVAGTLAPTQQAVFTTSYRVTQADIDAGSVTNTVSTTATPVRGTLTGPVLASVTSTAAAAPALSVTDSGALVAGSTGVAGDRVTFSYTVTNTGTVTLTGVALDENLAEVPGSLVFGTWPGTVGTLAPGQSVTATSSYALTQPDVDAHTVRSDITARGTSPAPASAVVTATSTASVAIDARPALVVAKGGALVAPGIGQVGDRIDYTLEATNPGNITLYRVDLVDRLAGLVITSLVWPTSVDGRIQPGQTARGTGYVIVTQADIDRGYIENTANVVGFATAATQPGEVPVTANSNTVRVPMVQPAPVLTTSTTGAITTGAGGVGSTVTWTDRVTNTGNVTVNVPQASFVDGVGLTGPVYDWSNAATPGILAPGEYAILRGATTITQTDVDAGSVSNLVTASGTSVRDGAPVVSNAASATVPTLASAPAITVTDDGALASPADARAGGTVIWSYRITNTGNVTLTSVGLSDALVGVTAPVYSWTTPVGTLAPGQFVDVRATSTLTQADVDAGSIISTATASGLPPAGAAATASDNATILVAASPVLTVTKTGALVTPGRNGVGDSVEFSFVLRNAGNVTLTGVTLSDTLPGLAAPTITWPTATAGVLPAGSTAQGTARYQLSQTDVDAGRVTNTANVTGIPPTGPGVIGQSALVTVPTAAAAPSVSITKGGALRSGTGSAGSVVRFTFAVTNTGNQTLTGPVITDTLPGLGAITLTLPGGSSGLTPGATAQGFADYSLTQTDVDRGYVDNSATVAANAPTVGVGAASNTFRFTTATPLPAIETTQSNAFAAGDTGVLGDTVEYTFTVRNTGNVTLGGVTFSNTVTGLAGLTYAWPDPANPGVLLPGQSATLTATHEVTQADVDLGVIRNVETGRGTPPTGAAVSDAADELVLPLATASTDLELLKTGTPQGTGRLGDTVVYEFTLTNDGTQTLSGASIADGLPGLSDLVYSWPTATVGVLPPGRTATATATYVITQPDVDRGTVTNVATASAVNPAGTRATAVSPASVVTVAALGPAIQISKSVALAAGATGRAGDTVEYRFEVVNTGDVTLNAVEVGDAQPGITGWRYTWPGMPGVLAPGQRLVATAVYTLTQPDVDAGVLSSAATTDGDGTRGGNVADADTEALVIAAAPALDFSKTAAAQTTPTVGSTIVYDFVLTNTGNVTLDGVAIADALLAPGAITYTWPGPNGILAPGQTLRATAAYTVTQADVDAGAVVNAATATATDPGLDPVTAVDSATIAIPDGTAIGLGISGTIADGRPGFAGDTVVFTYVVTNTGTRTLTDVTVTDPRAGLGALVYGPWPDLANPGVLLPGQTVTATASYVITAADEGRPLVETAHVSSVGATAAQLVEADAATTVQLPARPGIPGAPGVPGGPLVVTGSEPLIPGIAALALVLWGLTLIGAATLRRRKEHA